MAHLNGQEVTEVLSVAEKSQLKAKIDKALKLYPYIIFAVLFGSIAEGRDTPLSDVDVGIYVSKDLPLLEQGKLVAELEKALGREVDLVILNEVPSKYPELAFRVAARGELILCRDRKSYVEFKTKCFLSYIDAALLREQFRKAHPRRVSARKNGDNHDARPHTEA